MMALKFDGGDHVRIDDFSMPMLSLLCTVLQYSTI